MALSESRNVIITNTPAATAALGARCAARLSVGQVVCLNGPLGAGKTTFARGLIAAWTGEDEAPSPTYTLVQTYEGPRGPLWHVDLYRLNDPDEALELGLEEAFADAVTVIEWPERLGVYLPADRIDVSIGPQGEARRLEIVGHGRWEGTRLAE